VVTNDLLHLNKKLKSRNENIRLKLQNFSSLKASCILSHLINLSDFFLNNLIGLIIFKIRRTAEL